MKHGSWIHCTGCSQVQIGIHHDTPPLLVMTHAGDAMMTDDSHHHQFTAKKWGAGDIAVMRSL